MMEAMEPLLNAAGADLVFAGHVHAYERTVYTYLPLLNKISVFQETMLRSLN